MSLQVWLPLNGSYENLGLKNVDFLSKSGSFVDIGKIGAKGFTNGAITMAAKDIASFYNNEEMSFAFWIYPNADDGTTASTNLIGTSGMTAPNNRKFTIYNYSTVNDLHLSWQNDTSSTFVGGLWSDVFPSYQWTHCAITYKNPNVTIYINGEKKATVSGESNSASFEFDTSICKASSLQVLNDLRIYDSCLSPKEVREIANGLIIHYPMRDMDIEAVDNLTSAPVVTGDCTAAWDASLHLGAKNVSGWSNGYNGGVGSPSVGYHAYWKVIDDIPTMVMTNKNSEYSKTNRWLGISSSSSATMSAAIMSAGIYTISFDARTDTVGTKITGGLYSRLTTATKNGFNDGQFAFYPTAEWKRYSITVIPNASISSTVGSSVYFYGYTGGEGITYIRNPQIVAGESSVYVGNQVSDGGLCIDSSGYYNNASLVAGKVTYSDDSPRGYGCFKFDGSSYLRTSDIVIPQINTISIWVNRHAGDRHLIDWRNTNGVGLQPIYVNGSGAIQYWSSGAVSDASTYFSYNIPADEWHHIALACDGATVKLYVDGVERGSKATGIAAGAYPITLGARCNASNIGEAEMADFRVYATALSADEILKLYNTPIWIDENQTLGAIGFEETEVDNNKFNKTGNVNTQEVNTVLYDGKVKTKFLEDGSAWARINYLDMSSDKTCFTAAEVDYCPDKENRFSIMKDIDKFKGAITIPSQYARLEYIESTGTQYIDTNYYWTNENVKIVMDANVISNSSSQSLFGNEEPFSGGRYFSIVPHGSNGNYSFYVGSSTAIASASTGIGTRFTMECETTTAKVLTVKINGTASFTKTYSGTVMGYANTTSTHASKGKIYIFANHNSSTAGASAIQNIGGMQLYNFKMYDGGTLVRNFIPCQRVDGKVGLYDAVSEQFFSNAGTGDFVAGAAAINNEVATDGTYEFMLTYPSLSSALYNRWKQTVSPNETATKTLDGTGYEAIHTDFTTYAAPLRKAMSGSSIYCCNISGNWWAPIGQTTHYNNGIPAADGSTQTFTELWVRIDHLDYNTLNELFINDNAKVKIYNNYILANSILEI